jgi:hypothetical protein
MLLFLYCANKNRMLTALKQTMDHWIHIFLLRELRRSKRRGGNAARIAATPCRLRVYLQLHWRVSVQVPQHRLRAMTNDSSFEPRTDRENPTETCHKKPEMRNVLRRKLYDIVSVPADPSPAPGFLPFVSYTHSVFATFCVRWQLVTWHRTRLREKLLTHTARSSQ